MTPPCRQRYIVGAGARGLPVLERLCANAAAMPAKYPANRW
jgi:hypothetical protein